MFGFIMRLTKHLHNRATATANHGAKIGTAVTLDFVMLSKTDTDTRQ
jgi:hypothetical protein